MAKGVCSIVLEWRSNYVITCKRRSLLRKGGPGEERWLLSVICCPRRTLNPKPYIKPGAVIRYPLSLAVIRVPLSPAVIRYSLSVIPGCYPVSHEPCDLDREEQEEGSVRRMRDCFPFWMRKGFWPGYRSDAADGTLLVTHGFHDCPSTRRPCPTAGCLLTLHFFSVDIVLLVCCVEVSLPQVCA